MVKLTSRKDDSPLKRLQDVVWVLNDAMQTGEVLAEDMPGIMKQLDDSAVNIAELYMEKLVAVHSLLNREQILINQGKAMHKDLEKAVQVFNMLIAPATNEALISKVIGIIKHEAAAEVDLISDDLNPLDITVKLTMEENALREAIRVAICEYNNEIVQTNLNPSP